jgi:Na+/melibiose symporter-like transporter
VFFAGFVLRQTRATNPLIIPSLLKNRGFNAGLIIGLAFFAAVGGLAYVVSLFFQLVLRLTPSEAALGLAPMAAGIIVAAIVCRPLLRPLGRKLVFIGLVTALAGALGLWVTVVAAGSGVTPWMTAPSILLLGIGMGACFTSVYDIALGDLAHNEAGSASGALSAVQQLATAIGSAVVTTIFFSTLRTDGGTKAMAVSVVVVAAIVVVCLGLVWLLPKAAPGEDGALEPNAAESLPVGA